MLGTIAQYFGHKGTNLSIAIQKNFGDTTQYLGIVVYMSSRMTSMLQSAFPPKGSYGPEGDKVNLGLTGYRPRSCAARCFGYCTWQRRL